jgi:hypothetical protein
MRNRGISDNAYDNFVYCRTAEHHLCRFNFSVESDEDKEETSL